MTLLSVPILGFANGCHLTPTSGKDLWAERNGGTQESFDFTTGAGARWASIPMGQYAGTGGGQFDPVSSRLAYLDYGQVSGPDNIFRVQNQGRTLTAQELETGLFRLELIPEWRFAP